jgi:hypothetical protein
MLRVLEPIVYPNIRYIEHQRVDIMLFTIVKLKIEIAILPRATGAAILRIGKNRETRKIKIADISDCFTINEYIQ